MSNAGTFNNGAALTAVQTIAGDSGSASGNTITFTGIPAGLFFTASGSTVSLSVEAPIVVTGASQALVSRVVYIANSGSLITFTLPATASIGDRFEIVGKGAGLYSIAQNSGQNINFLSSTTTTGVGGSLTATQQYQRIVIMCITANTQFSVIDASGSTWTVV